MKYFVWLFVFVLAVGLVGAADGWGDINPNGSGDEDSVVNNSGSNGSVDDVSVGDASDTIDDDPAVSDYSGEGGFEYTDNFYIALGLGGFGFLIVLYFIYLFFRRPKNRWKSRK